MLKNKEFSFSIFNLKYLDISHQGIELNQLFI
jgi:hypothetical protein